MVLFCELQVEKSNVSEPVLNGKRKNFQPVARKLPDGLGSQRSGAQLPAAPWRWICHIKLPAVSPRELIHVFRASYGLRFTTFFFPFYPANVRFFNLSLAKWRPSHGIVSRGEFAAINGSQEATFSLSAGLIDSAYLVQGFTGGLASISRYRPITYRRHVCQAHKKRGPPAWMDLPGTLPNCLRGASGSNAGP